MEYNKELKLLKLFKFRFNNFTIFISNVFLKILPKKLKSNKELVIKKYKIKQNNRSIKVYGFFPRTSVKESMIYFHGGAFYLKGAPYHYTLCKEYASKGNINVFYVDYSLAPKTKYPEAITEGLTVYEWLINNSVSLNISKDIALSGDSAGSNIVLGLDIMLKEKGIIPKFNMLIYPVIDNIKTKSKEMFKNTPMWNSKLDDGMWKRYLGDVKYDSIFNHNICINTYIETCEMDPLHDEGVMYYEHLNNNAKCILNETKGTMHGYDLLYKSNIAKENIQKRIEFIRKMK